MHQTAAISIAAVTLVVEGQHWQKPFLLASDWNDSPDSELLQEIAKHFIILSDNGVSYPADKPTECLDYIAIFKGRAAEVLESTVIDEPEASDHRPVVVRVELR